MTVIDEYIKKFSPEQRKELERIREIAKKVVPDAEDCISYAMPTLKHNGVSFLGFDIYTHHIGIYPYGGEEIEKLKEQLKHYKCSKGAIQVPFNKPIPEELLKKIITLRIKRIERN